MRAGILVFLKENRFMFSKERYKWDMREHYSSSIRDFYIRIFLFFQQSSYLTRIYLMLANLIYHIMLFQIKNPILYYTYIINYIALIKLNFNFKHL